MFDGGAEARVLGVVWRLLLMRSMLWSSGRRQAAARQCSGETSENLPPPATLASSSTSHATAAGLLRSTCTLGRCDNMNALVGYGSSDEEEEVKPTRPSKVGDCYSRELGSVDAY